MVGWRRSRSGFISVAANSRAFGVYDWFFRQRSSKRQIDWLAIDAWLDSTLAETWERIKDGYDAASSFFARFRLTGWRRLLKGRKRTRLNSSHVKISDAGFCLK